MVKQPADSITHTPLQWWRAIAVAVLTTIGIVSLTSFMVAHWVHRQILTTDNWVSMVSTLPANDEVAGALSTYSVDQFFTTVDVEAKIQQALPDRAAFLAPPLADQLQTRVTNLTKNVIQSDKFAAVWISANRLASQRLLEGARNTDTQETQAKPARFALVLPALKSTVGTLLDRNSPTPETTGNSDGGNDVGVAVNLKTSIKKLHTYIRLADFINSTIGLFAVVCLTGAVAISLKRRRLVITIGLAILIIALLQLIGMKAGRPQILQLIQDASFRPAAGVVYDAVLKSMQHTTTVAVIVGAVVFLLAYLTKPSLINRSKYLRKQLKHFGGTKFVGWVRTGRQYVRQYRWQAALVILLVGLLLMAFVFTQDWAGIVRNVLWILLIIELINLVAARTKEAPMKQ